MNAITQQKRDTEGYSNVARLRLEYENKKYHLENDFCVCGHPKFMHYPPGVGDSFCRVHGCKEPNNHSSPCLKFVKDKGLHNETL